MFYRLLLLVVFVAGCSKKADVPPSTAQQAVVAVTVEKPKRKTMRWTIEQPGTILPFEVTPLVAKLPGYVEKLYVDIGDKVTGPGPDGKTPGMLLADISIPEIEQEYKQKEALKEQARQEVILARQNLKVAEASYAVAQQVVKEMEAGEKRAESNYQRWKGESVRVDDLVKRMVIDKQTAEETRNQYASAESSRDEALARTKSSAASVLESKAKLDRASLEIETSIARQAFADADFERLKALKQYTQIRAPYDGIVTQRHVHTGHFLQSSGGRGEAILTVACLDPVRIVVDVPEAAADRVSKDASLTVRVQTLRGAEFKGKVARTSWSLHPDSRSLHVEIDLPNPDGRIRPGMYAYASIPVEVPDVLVIPQAALVYQDEMAFCWIVEDGKATRYQLQTGQRDGDNYEVIRRKKGNAPWQAFSGEEAVIVSHRGPIAEGQKVESK